MVASSNLNSQTRPHYFRNCKNKTLKTNINSLPDDVVFDILVRIPAQDIYNVVRLVCGKWYQMINSPNFIDSHLHHSTRRFLVLYPPIDRKYSTSVAMMRQGLIEISKFGEEHTKLMWSSCNGLVLEPRTSQYDICVNNLATKRSFRIPQFVPKSPFWCNTLAYAHASMKYKVFCTSYDIKAKSQRCAMLTLGVDKSWRHLLAAKHLSQTATKLVRCIPLTTEGFVHWTRKGTYVLTLNVETEIFTLNPVPECRGETLEYYYLSAGSFLSLLIVRTKFSWEVWEMKPESGEWTKMANIDLEARKCSFNCDLYKPVSWLNYGEVFVFNAYNGMGFNIPRLTGLCFAYNVRSKEIESFELESDRNIFLFHRNSLVMRDGC